MASEHSIGSSRVDGSREVCDCSESLGNGSDCRFDANNPKYFIPLFWKLESVPATPSWLVTTSSFTCLPNLYSIGPVTFSKPSFCSCEKLSSLRALIVCMVEVLFGFFCFPMNILHFAIYVPGCDFHVSFTVFTMGNHICTPSEVTNLHSLRYSAAVVCFLRLQG